MEKCGVIVGKFMLIVLYHLKEILKNFFFSYWVKDPSKEHINDSAGAAEKKKKTFSNANTQFCVILHYKGNKKSYLYVNKTEICKFKANENIS